MGGKEGVLAGKGSRGVCKCSGRRSAISMYSPFWILSTRRGGTVVKPSAKTIPVFLLGVLL